MKDVMNILNGLGASLDYTKCLFDEDSLSVIKLLLETTTTTCCLPDEDGMTPLLRATSNSYLPAVEAIIDYYPESVEICDLHGRNFLHLIKFQNLSEARKILRIPGISSMVDRQDEDGNTPLHIAIMNRDYNLIKAMIECSANFVIKNKNGISPATLIQLDSSSLFDKTEDDVGIRRTCNNDEVMPKELFEAAYKKNWQYLISRLAQSGSENQFLSRLPDGSNIVHVAVQHCSYDYQAEYFGYPNDDENYSSFREEFIVEAPKMFPILHCQTGLKGRTPLHYAMYRNILKPGGKAFQTLVDHLTDIKEQRCGVRCALPPWEVKDDNGHTLLHLALMFKRYSFAKFLIDLDSDLIRERNYTKETAFHIFCQRGQLRGTLEISRNSPAEEQEEIDMVDLLVAKDATMVYSYDVDGYTPLLRAVENGSLNIAQRIIQHCPQSINQFHSQSDRSVCHLMKLNPRDVKHREFSKLPQIEKLLGHRDRKGNTALHLAIEQGRFGTAQILMENLSCTSNSSIEYKKYNYDGKTVLDVLAKAQDIPRWFQDYLSTKWLDLPFRNNDTGNSIYGVRYSNMKEYMGPLGVVAALLTTITFTAAFTIPGGYDQKDGTPVMAREIAFQVFMFTDVVGMCSSMMVLFCLLWFLNSGRVEHEGSQLVDLSIGLLQLSFHATLLAFMTGIYVTTFPDIHWLAIFTCVLCSVVLVLMRKRIILDFVVHVFYYLFTFSWYVLTYYPSLIARKFKLGI